MARGDRTPMLDDEPDLMPHLEPIMSAFIYLSNQRQSGMDANRLSIGAIVAYLDEFGIEDGDLRELYLTLLPAMDTAFMEHAAKKRDKSSAHPNQVHSDAHPPGVARRRR